MTSLIHILIKTLKRETILAGQFSRDVSMSMYQYQVPCVDLFFVPWNFLHIDAGLELLCMQSSQQHAKIQKC